MKRVAVTAGSLDILQGLRGLSDRINGCVIATGNIVFLHHRASERPRPNLASSTWPSWRVWASS